MSLSSPLFVLLTMVPIIATLLLGAQLKLRFVHELVRRPRALIVGLMGQFLFLPLLAAVFLYTYPAPAHLQGGWFILAAVPGGAISNMVTFLGRGRLSLSVVLTACSTLAGIVTIPVWVNVGMTLAGGEVARELPIASMVLGSFLVLVVPLALGIATAIWKPVLAERLREPTRRAMVVLLVVGLGAYLAQRWQFIVADFSLVMLAGAALFHTLAVLAAWSGARVVGLDGRDSFTLGIEVGIQNVVVGLLVVELLDRSELVPLIGYYALVMMVLLFLWVALLGRHQRSESPGRNLVPDAGVR